MNQIGCPSVMSPYRRREIQRAVEVLTSGGIVAFPTDTLYGLGAHAFIPEAVERVYKAKGRPSEKALPLLLASADGVSRVARNFSRAAEDLAKAFWPGALTLVVKCSERIPEAVTGGGDTVAIRVPNHALARMLITRLGAPVTGTSANRAGSPHPFTAAIVREQLGDVVDLIIDGGPCPGGQPSTVVDVTGPRPALIREGAVSRDAIERVCGLLAEA